MAMNFGVSGESGLPSDRSDSRDGRLFLEQETARKTSRMLLHGSIRKKLTTLLLLLGSILAWAPSLHAQPQDEPEPDRTIYVPFKNLQEVLKKHAASAFIPYEEYLKFLSSQTASNKQSTPADTLITEARYVATVEKNLANIKATLKVRVLGKPWVELPLAFGKAAVEKLTTDTEEILLQGRKDGSYALLLGHAGEHTVTLDLQTKVRTSPDGRELVLDVPPVGITRFEIIIPEANQTVEITPDLVSTTIEPEGNQATTHVQATVGATKAITARWHPKASLKPEMDLLTSVTNQQRIGIEQGLVHHDAWLTFHVLRGSLEQIELAVPLGQRILDVSADARLQGWQAKQEANRQLVTLQLLSPVEKSVTVEVHTEQNQPDEAFPLAGIDDDGAVHGIHAVGAVRESGQIAIQIADDLTFDLTSQRGLTRIDPELLDKQIRPGADAAFKFYNPRFALVAAARPVEPRLAVNHLIRLVFHDDELRFQSHLDYQVERSGLFELVLKLPDNVTIDDVNTTRLKEYNIDPNTNTLRIRLAEKTLGQLRVDISGHRVLSAQQDHMEQELPLIEPLQVERETGTVQIFAPPAIEVVTNQDAVQSAQPAPTDPADQVGEARMTAAWTFTRRPVRIPVSTTRKPARLSVVIGTEINVLPETVDVTTRLMYSVEFAGVDTFLFHVPEAISDRLQLEVEQSGSGAIAIKQKTSGKAVNGWVPWTVVLQRDLLGSQTFRITYRLTKEDLSSPEQKGDETPEKTEPDHPPRQTVWTIALIRPDGKPADPGKENAVPLSQVRGELSIANDRTLSISADASGGGIEPMDIRELTLLPQTGTLAYRYFRHAADEVLQVRITQSKYEIQQVVPTVIEKGLVEIATGRNSPATYRCRYLVKTIERQRLRIDLPKEMELLGAFLDGREVKLSPVDSSQVGDQADVSPYYVNVAREKPSDDAFVLLIQFNWNVNPAPFEGLFGRGEVTFPLPRIGGTANPAQVQELRTAISVPENFWVIRSSEDFTLLKQPPWWSGLLPNFQPDVTGPAWDEVTHSVGLSFPTDGLVTTTYTNLGGASSIDLIWWDRLKVTLILSVALALVAFILLGTSWENKLSLILLLIFIAMLVGVKDRGILTYGLAAARWGLLFLISLWVVHALLSGRAKPRYGATLPAGPKPWSHASLYAVSPPQPADAFSDDNT